MRPFLFAKKLVGEEFGRIFITTVIFWHILVSN